MEQVWGLVALIGAAQILNSFYIFIRFPVDIFHFVSYYNYIKRKEVQSNGKVIQRQMYQ